MKKDTNKTSLLDGFNREFISFSDFLPPTEADIGNIERELERKRNLPLADVVAIFKNSRVAAKGILYPTIKGEAYNTISALTDKVAAQMNLKAPRLITYRGYLSPTAYYPDYDVVFICEKYLSILTEKELSWLIAHELDHMSKVANIDKMERWKIKSGYYMEEFKEGLPGKTNTTSNLKKDYYSAFRRMLELKADDRANELFGADTGHSELIKTMITIFKEYPEERAHYFPELKGSMLYKISDEQLRKRFEEIADNAFEPEKYSLMKERIVRSKTLAKKSGNPQSQELVYAGKDTELKPHAEKIVLERNHTENIR